jgi:hypothetical protein
MHDALEKSVEWADLVKPFTPIASYYETMDILIYLNADVSYRAERVDEWLTLLWHPYRKELVGIQLKGFRCACRESAALSRIAKNDDVFLPLAALVASRFLKEEAEALIEAPMKERREALMRKYDQALVFVARENARVSLDSGAGTQTSQGSMMRLTTSPTLDLDDVVIHAPITRDCHSTSDLRGRPLGTRRL